MIQLAICFKAGISSIPIPRNSISNFPSLGLKSNRTITDILNSLVKQTKRVTKNTGELVLLKLNEMDKIDEELESKLIVNFYKPETKAGEIYISIPGTLERLDYLKSVNTNPSVNTRIEHFPVV